MLHGYCAAQEYVGRLAETSRRLGRKETAGASTRKDAVDFSVTMQVVVQTGCHDIALGHHADIATTHCLLDLRHQERIVRASQHDSIYLVVLGQQLVDILMNEIVGTGTHMLAGFDKRHP